MTTSEDTALVLTTTVFPDWSQGVRSFYTYEGATITAASGNEQRTSRRARARKAMEYTVDGMTANQSRDIFSVLENRGAGPLLVPWFPEGKRISVTMSAVTQAQVEVDPLDDWLEIGDRILIGTDLREVTGIADRVLTLATGTFTLWPSGTWAFPMRRAAIDRPEDSVAVIRFDAVAQRLRFVQLEK